MVNWEQRYHKGDTPWDKGAPSPPLRAWLNRNPISGRVLVPGCGTGEDVRLLAQYGLRVTGLDIAESALSRAGKYPNIAGEQYILGDILNLPPALTGIFDWVFEHTCYCAIDPGDRDAYVRGVARALRPGGHLLGLFFPFTGNPPGEGPPFPATLQELNLRFQDQFILKKRWTPTVGYPGRVHNEDFRILQKRGPH